MHVIFKNSVTSTQDIAFQILREDLGANSICVMASQQTCGRGRSGKNWVSDEPGNLYMSIGLRLAALPDFLPIFLSLTVAEYITNIGTLGNLLRLKWPNDLLLIIDGVYKKFGGILIERHSNCCIIGIGVNVGFTPSVMDIPVTSLADVEVILPVKLLQMAEGIYSSVLASLQSIIDDDSSFRAAILNRWLARHWKNKGDEIKIKIGREVAYTGKFITVNHDGHIVLEMLTGDKKTFSYGDVTF